jgi:hypothetical protein
MTPRPPVGLPEALAAALMTALGFEPVHRPKTIAELATLIRGAAWDGDTKAAPAAPLAKTTQRTRARGVIAGAGMIAAFAAAIGVALVVSQHRGRKAAAEPEAVAAAEPAAVAVDAGVGPQPVVVVSIAVDAGVVDAARIEEAAEKRTKTRTKSKSKTKPKATTTATATATGTATCQMIVDLYCTDEFKETEGEMKGVLCDTMTKNLPSLDEAWCQSSYKNMAGAVKERLRMWKEGLGPPTR